MFKSGFLLELQGGVLRNIKRNSKGHQEYNKGDYNCYMLFIFSIDSMRGIFALIQVFKITTTYSMIPVSEPWHNVRLPTYEKTSFRK